MKKFKKIYILLAFVLAAAVVITAIVITGNKENLCEQESMNEHEQETTTVYGRVTEINGSNITIELGILNTMPGNGTPGTEPNGMPEAPKVGMSGMQPNKEQEMHAGGTPETQPGGTPEPSSEGTTGTYPRGTPETPVGTMEMQPLETPTAGNRNRPGNPVKPDRMNELLILSGESITITITDTGILTKETMVPMNQASGEGLASGGTSATLEDISTGDILKVVYRGSTENLVSVTILSMGPKAGMPNGFAPGGPGGGMGMRADNVYNGTAAYTLSDGESITGGTYTSENADENAIRADSVTAYLADVTVTKNAGGSSNNDASSFYGLNSAILALGTAKLDITGGTVTAAAEGANGVFAYGNPVINIKDTEIDVSGGNAGGIQVAGGGTIKAENLTVTSKVKAAIRSDRGGGTIVVNGGTYTTGGSSGAPAIYSTADITVNDAVLTSNDSEAVVVEGFNSVTLNNCAVTGNMSGTYGDDSGENIHNVMLYQSMSGDAEVGKSSFIMNGGSLVSKSGDMFYVTNTECDVVLNNVELTLARDANLLTVAGNDGSRGWGKAGANGGVCNFTVTSQIMSGDIAVDSISKLNLSLNESSSYTGAINKDGTAAAFLSVTLDSTSTWILTGDSYITEFNGSLDNVITNGYTLYVNNIAVK